MTTQKTQQWLGKILVLVGELRFIYVSIFHSSHSVCLPNSTFLVNVLWRKKWMWFCLARIKSCRSSVCASPSLASTLFYSVLPGVHFSKSILSTRCHCFWPKWMSELAQSFLLVLKMQISEPCQSTSNTALPGTVFLTCKCSQREKCKRIHFPKERLCFVGDTWRWYHLS